MNLNNIRHAFRKNSLLITVTFGLILSIGLIFYYAEQSFRNEKNRFIIQNKDRFFTEVYILNQDLPSQALLAFTTDSSSVLKVMENQFTAIVNDPQSIIFDMEFRSKNNGKVLLKVSNYNKQRLMNTYDNCLFVRSFARTNTVLFDVSQENKAELVITYTSPESVKSLKDIVVRYRWRFLPVLLGLVFIYVGSLRWFILPVRRVIDKLEGIKDNSSLPIKNPRTLLEDAYNRMARNTQILKINKEMNDCVISNPEMNRDELLTALLGLCREVYPSVDYLVRREEKSLPDKGIALIEKTHEDELYLHVPIATGFLWNINDDQALSSLAQQIQLGLQTRELQRRYVEQEKSQVSIHLARSLGHDVTNILAGIRWDLDTLQTVLAGSTIEASDSDQQKRQTIFQESMESLGHSTELLQEIIEIYRSFMFVEKPEFEKVSLEPVLSRLLELFQRSTTYHIKMTLIYGENIPQVYVDTRLIRLAVFNLLTNALDAIKKLPVARPENGEIEIEAATNSEQTAVIFYIRDNGIGLRSANGALLDEDSISHIFEQGYTTKKQSGGLGLAWVKIIIASIHGGTISACNRIQGGTEFKISLPMQK